MENLSEYHEDHPNQHKNKKTVHCKGGIPFRVWKRVVKNWDNNMIRISQWSEYRHGTMLGSEDKNKPIKVRLWESSQWTQ